VNSRAKGVRGERQWRDELRANGYRARRGQQFSGSPESPDVVSDDLPWAHFEVKVVEKLNIYDAIEQALRDCGRKVPFVSHRRNHRPWLVTMTSEVFFRFLRGTLPPESNDKNQTQLQPNENQNQ
jgi:Holliday junction resolvase